MNFLKKLQNAQIEDRYLGLFEDKLSSTTKEKICALENDQIQKLLLDAMNRTPLDHPDLDFVVNILITDFI